MAEDVFEKRELSDFEVAIGEIQGRARENKYHFVTVWESLPRPT